ncbi:MAG: phosphate/phosphite/phosphonate ABC transporter substrate-binding protein [Wenzhouxiangella sp.]
MNHPLASLALLVPVATLSALASSPVRAQNHVLQVHPTFPPQQAELVYQPLLDYLNATTGHQFELQTARDFHRYWVDIRRGQQPDLVLEDAHLIALRIERDGFRPLARASTPTTFSLLTTRPESDLDLADFVGLSVSSLPAPSLGHLVLADWYPNPMQQPLIQSSASSWLDAVEIVFAMEADAAIVPHNLVARYVNMTAVATSSEFPHMTIAASPDLADSVAEAVRSALIELHEDPDYFGALHELDIERFVPASADEYAGLERWLDRLYGGF